MESKAGKLKPHLFGEVARGEGSGYLSVFHVGAGSNGCSESKARERTQATASSSSSRTLALHYTFTKPAAMCIAEAMAMVILLWSTAMGVPRLWVTGTAKTHKS